MHFFVGDSLDTVKTEGKNIEYIEFSAELVQYLYNLRNKVSFSMETLFKINPYGDEVLTKQDIVKLQEICKNIEGTTDILSKYGDFEEGKESVAGLLKLSSKALQTDRLLISFGD